ncbi:MAG TPA: transposase [Phycisphaerae bacterium]|nr:transposase [Phycisphaerae bacterium]HRY70637.1 transposase [Phycisphaerae bacterium]HSA28952.1 transposase [Phycisphaerae bacterium]
MRPASTHRRPHRCLLIHALRRLGLTSTPLEQAQAPTLRQKWLKIGMQVRVTTRRVWLSWSQAYPYHEPFRRVYENLIRLAPLGRPTLIPQRVSLPLRC